jgi:hypothetical protein
VEPDRIRRLDDIEQIRALKARYCRLSDRGYEGAGDSPAGVAALFAEDGTWGETRRRDEIRRLFEGFQEALPFSFHVAVNAEIEVDADRAHGRWAGVIRLRDAAGESTWVVGVYEDSFVRTEEGWRFESVAFTAADRFAAG